VNPSPSTYQIKSHRRSGHPASAAEAACSRRICWTCRRIFSGSANDPYSNLTDLGVDVANRDVAWTEITRVCSDLVSDVTKGLEQNTEWQIELLDAFRKPLFRVRVVAESFE
jgi:hypothetical protein